MNQEVGRRFELQPILQSTLPEVAGFIHRWDGGGVEGSTAQLTAGENMGSIERRLRWLLTENPVASTSHEIWGYCVRDHLGVIRGLDLFYPVAFLCWDKRLLGLCSGTFRVEPPARSLGFYLFKKCLNTPGYSFYFASSCNANSSELWRRIGARPVPRSETEFMVPLRVDAVLAAYVGLKTSSKVAARIARTCGRTANPIFQLLRRGSVKLTVEPCQDWEKLSELSYRHRSPDHVASDRSPALLRWRYGPGSPLHPSNVFLFRDALGNEGWFSLGYLTRGQRGQFRASVLLDLVWPRKEITFRDIFQQVLRMVSNTDAVSFQWQPGLDYRQLGHFLIRRKLKAPLAFVRIPKGGPQIPLDSLDCDPSDFIAWAF